MDTAAVLADDTQSVSLIHGGHTYSTVPADGSTAARMHVYVHYVQYGTTLTSNLSRCYPTVLYLQYRSRIKQHHV